MALRITGSGNLGSAPELRTVEVNGEDRKVASMRVFFAHNHPSGDTEPSRADRDATTRLKAALDLVDVRVLDHFIIGKGTPLSFAEEGYL